MKTWIKRSLIGLGAAAILLGGMAACGHRAYHAGWGSMDEATASQWRERFVSRAAKKLELDTAQQQRLTTLTEALAEQRRALMPAGSPPRAELAAIIGGATLDRARAQAMVDAKTAAVQSHAPKVVAAAADFFDALKPEQQRELREMLAKLGHGRGEGRGDRHGHGRSGERGG